ncbi:Lrp/AsnC family transcriptional regulator [Pseudomonas chlororaphis]|nr:Lrp/AsnC family transcriptional regulator [Pseudomonas chlororaphis]
MKNLISGKPLEPVDLKILNVIQHNGRISNLELSADVGLSSTPCWRRLKSLEQRKFITSYHARLDRKLLGYDIHAYVLIEASVHTEQETRNFEKFIISRDEVLAFHNVTGNFDFVIQVIARTMDEYVSFIENVLRKVPTIKTIQSNITLRELKNQSQIPLPLEL